MKLVGIKRVICNIPRDWNIILFAGKLNAPQDLWLVPIFAKVRVIPIRQTPICVSLLDTSRARIADIPIGAILFVQTVRGQFCTRRVGHDFTAEKMRQKTQISDPFFKLVIILIVTQKLNDGT